MELRRSAPLYQQIYHLLRQQILAGEHTPGEPMLESHIARTLHVSRTPVREALRQLEREGLVVTRGSELVVADPTKEEFVDLYTCRAALEQIVAERASRFASQSEIDAMEAALREAEEAMTAGNHAGVLAANTRFHDQMVQSARMQPLQDLMNTIRGQILVARRQVLADSLEVERAIGDEHARLLEAIRQRHVQRAKERMEMHMKNDIERGLANFAAIEEPPGAPPNPGIG